MTTLLVVLSLGFGLCVVLTPAVRTLARRYGLVDRPDGRRKMHSAAIPVSGGIALLLSVSIAVALTLIFQNPFRLELAEQGWKLAGLFSSAVVIVLVGLADDALGLRGRHKLMGQLFAIAIVMSSGLVVYKIRLFDWELELGLLAIPFTVFWLLGAINSLNLIDGVDGLLSSVGIIVSLAMAAMAVLCGHGAAACVAVALAGSLLGFLCYNFPPASIFLGDSGSMLIGLVLGVLAIQASLKAPATIALAAPVAALTIPILDTMAAIIRRKLTGRSIYETDRGHLHHCLLKRGLSNRGVLLCVSLFSLATAGGALVSLALKNELFAILSGFAVIVVLVASRLFGYVEFLLLRDRIVATGAWFLGRRTQTAPVETTVRLQGSADWAELWGTLTDCATRHQLKVVRLDVNAPSLGEAYHAEWNCLSENEENNSQVWWAEVPLRALGQTIGRLQLVGQRNRGSAWSQIASVADSLEGLEDAVTALAAAPKSRSGVAARAGLMAGPVAVASSVLDGTAVEANRALTASDSDIAIEALA